MDNLGSSFSLRMRRPRESSSANKAIKVVAAIDKSTTIAYAGKTMGSINAGTIGITPNYHAERLVAYIGVF